MTNKLIEFRIPQSLARAVRNKLYWAAIGIGSALDSLGGLLCSAIRIPKSTIEGATFFVDEAKFQFLKPDATPSYGCPYGSMEA